jgi:hypothetical protein
MPLACAAPVIGVQYGFRAEAIMTFAVIFMAMAALIAVASATRVPIVVRRTGKGGR